MSVAPEEQVPVQEQQSQPTEVKVEAGTEGQVVEEEGKGEEQKTITIPPVTIKVPAPAHGRTLPKRTPAVDYSIFDTEAQNQESIQDLKMILNESVSGYWLGPYSLRLPRETKGSDDKVERTAEDGMPKEGQTLSEYLELGEVFGTNEQPRVLEVAKDAYTEFTARQMVFKLLELTAPGGTSANNLSDSIALQGGSTIFESVRDGVANSLVPEIAYEEVDVTIPTGRKGKNGKKESVKVRREIDGNPDQPFQDWKWRSYSYDQLPMAQPPLESLPCLRAMQLSQFNPPQPHLKQLGHLLYLQVGLLEGETNTLICTSRGWYVSKSNVNQFDPAPKSPIFHSLFDLLHSISPKFSERLNKLPPLSTTPPALEPLSTVPIPQAEPAFPFLANAPKTIQPEILRTQCAYLHTGTTTAVGLDSSRDWNEEIQGTKDLPKNTMQERSVREKMLHKTLTDFTNASVQGVLAVARGDIVPLNPNEEARAHMWMYSNIFVTKAVDSIDAYSHLGGDAAAFVSHLKDANGVKILHKLDIDGASLLGHTVVDWQGERWVCQSIMPGIFTRRKDDEDWVKVENETEAAPEKTENQLITYGLDSEDNGTIHWDEASHRLMAKVGDAHRLAAHKVKDAKGQEFEFYAGAEVKALKGTDGRRYLLDLPRLSPVDVEWLENSMESYPHRVVLLRPELLELFWESELKRYAKSFTKDDEEEKMDPVALGEKLKDFELKFNPDAFVDYPGKDGQVFTPSTITDESEPSIKAVRDASQFLQTVAIPAVVFDCMTGNLTNVIDGQSLTRHLHSRGINMRYLGKLHENILKFAKGDDAESAHTGHLAALSNLIVHEAIYRGSKHVLRKLVAGLSPELVPNAVSHFLNCLFGTEYNSKPTAVYEPLFENETRPAYVSLTATDLHAQIAKEIENRYKLTLESTPALKISRPKQLLREIATRFAFQIKQRDYVFEKTEKTTRATIFEPSDILTLVPVVRSTAPSVTIAEEVFEAGRTAIARGNMDLGLDIMAEAVGMYENIHSVIHPEVAGAYNAFASAMHQGARMRIQQLSQEEGHDPEQPLNVDVSSAVRLQRQAIIISERTRGVYDATTLSYYFNLAMLENLEGNTIASLRYFKHCLMLWDVIHGPDHPEINTILSNVGVILQSTGDNASSLNMLTQAANSTLSQFGPDHILYAATLHQLTQAHFLVNDIPSAYETVQKAHEIYKTKLGEEHAHTKETGRNVELLKVVIENAERAKAASKAQVERIKASTKLGGLGKYKKVDEKGNIVIAPPAVSAGEAESSATGAQSNIGVKGTLDVDELVQFINGGGSTGGKSARGKNALRGKRRTGAKK